MHAHFDSNSNSNSNPILDCLRLSAGEDSYLIIIITTRHGRQDVQEVEFGVGGGPRPGPGADREHSETLEIDWNWLEIFMIDALAVECTLATGGSSGNS